MKTILTHNLFKISPDVIFAAFELLAILGKSGAKSVYISQKRHTERFEFLSKTGDKLKFLNISSPLARTSALRDPTIAGCYKLRVSSCVNSESEAKIEKMCRTAELLYKYQSHINSHRLWFVVIFDIIISSHHNKQSLFQQRSA